MNSVIVEDRQVLEKLASLDSKKMNKAYKEALKKSVAPIQKQAQRNLRKSGIKNITKRYVSKSGRTYGSMLSGIKTSIDVRKPGEEYAKVHIMGDFRLKWFEKGTSFRKTDRGWNRGRIEPKWFFRSAVNEKQAECEKILDENITASINKAYNK